MSAQSSERVSSVGHPSTNTNARKEAHMSTRIALRAGALIAVTALALTTRFATQGKADYAAKLLAQMRAGFGGHAVKKQ